MEAAKTTFPSASLLFRLRNNGVVVSFDGLPVHAHSRVISDTAFIMVEGIKVLLCFALTWSATLPLIVIDLKRVCIAVATYKMTYIAGLPD